MKNSAISKFTLGLFLIGFMASSVFATLKSETTNVINGNKPVIYQITDPNNAHELTVRITQDEAGNQLVGNGNPIKVGHFIHIKYKLQDTDGDKDKVNSSLIMPTLKVFIHSPKVDQDGQTVYEWREITLTNAPAYKIDNDIARITFKIDSQFIAADRIGFKLLERTQYGVPYVNNWINVTDILRLTPPYLKSAINEADWTKPDKIGPTITELRKEADKISANYDFGPGDTIRDNGVYPVEGGQVVGIFKYNDQGKLDLTVNYASTKNTNPPTPKYGEKFGVVVWVDDKNADELPGANEVVVTDKYSYKWKLFGKYEDIDADNIHILNSAEGVSNDDLSIYLGSTTGKDHNAIYTTPSNGYKAGAQGYQLQVDATPK